MQTVVEIQARIDKEKAKVASNKSLLSKLGGDRAKLAIQGGEKSAQTIGRLDKQMGTLRRDIENAPDIVTELKRQLAEATAKEKQKAMDALIEQQKSCAGQMEAISKKLVKALETANDLNIQLDVVTRRYCTLKEQTNQDIAMTTCWPSEQMLKVIYETLNAELQGAIPQRIAGHPPFVRI